MKGRQKQAIELLIEVAGNTTASNTAHYYLMLPTVTLIRENSAHYQDPAGP